MRLAPRPVGVGGESFLLTVVGSLVLRDDKFLVILVGLITVVPVAGLEGRSSDSHSSDRLLPPGVSVISVLAPPGVMTIEALCSSSITPSPESFSSELLDGRGASEGPPSVFLLFAWS